MAKVVLAILSAVLLTACVTTPDDEPRASVASGGSSATIGPAPAPRSASRSILEDRDRLAWVNRVMAMDWPSGKAPLGQLRPFVSRSALSGFRARLDAMETADVAGHDINPELIEAIMNAKGRREVLTTMDFSLTQTNASPLATQFMYLYAALQYKHGVNVDTLAAAMMAADIATVIDVGRCGRRQADPRTAIWMRRRDHSELYTALRNAMLKLSPELQRSAAKLAINMEAGSASVRRDERLCRYGPPYATETVCTEDRSGAFPITRCTQTGDNKSIPTHWAKDDEIWLKRRIGVLEQLTIAKLIETYSKPLPQVVP